MEQIVVRKTAKTKPKTKDQDEPVQDKSLRLSGLIRQPNPPRRSVKSGRKGRK